MRKKKTVVLGPETKSWLVDIREGDTTIKSLRFVAGEAGCLPGIIGSIKIP